MKLIKAECLYQTLVFILDPTLSLSEAQNILKTEVLEYKEGTLKNKSIRIIKEVNNPDGSVELYVKICGPDNKINEEE